MGKTEDGFGKKRDHNQYGDTDKDPKDKKKIEDLPDSPNKGTEKEKKDKS